MQWFVIRRFGDFWLVTDGAGATLGCKERGSGTRLDFWIHGLVWGQESICTDFQYFHCIDSCKATIKNDTLILNFHQETASTYDDIVICIWHDKFRSSYRTVYFAFDSGFNKWIPIKEKLILNTSNWAELTSIKGELQLEFQEIHVNYLGLESKTGKIKFSGPFNTTILK